MSWAPLGNLYASQDFGLGRKKMKRSFSRGTLMLSAGLLVAVACAGRSLQDVGDIQGEGGEANAGGNAAEPDGSGGEDVGVSGSTTTHGGAGGTRPDGDPDPIGGFGGGSGSEGFVCEACDLVAETPDIRDLWVQGEQLYWIEYGGFDELENYLENGRLMTMPVAGGT